jgi:putative flippase GtrA
MIRRIIDNAVMMLPARYQRVAKQFVKFGITGVIGAIVDFGTYNLLTRGFGFVASYIVLGQQIIVANNISVFFAIVSNFIFNKYWTFRDTSKQVARQWVGYFSLNFVTWVLNQFLVSIFAFQVPIIETMFGAQKDNAAKVLAIGIILFLNFAGSKFLVFKKQSRGLREAAV